MSWYYYDDGREQKARLRLKILREGKLKPLTVPQGKRKLAGTFWGKAWCDHLEAHRDFEYRLPRGRSYLRQGNVYDLRIREGSVIASVAGTSLYEVRITIRPLEKAAWEKIRTDCAGRVGSLLDLLGGRLGDGVLRAITHPERGLFPKPSEMKPLCSCPDYANLCKHAAAVLYGVGVMLDTNPDLFFLLRSVDPSELLGKAARETLANAQGADAALAGEDLSALFGIALDGESVSGWEPQKREDKKPGAFSKAKKRPVARKPAAKKKPKKKTAAKETRRNPVSRRKQDRPARKA